MAIIETEAHVIEARPVGTDRRAVAAVAAVAAGAAVALALGVYGRVHDPAGRAPFQLWFRDAATMKAWFVTAAVSLALLQIVSALWFYGRLPLPTAPAWVATAHRWTGTAAFLLTLPVAYLCLWSFGFQHDDARRLAHSIAGCAFFGVFTTKVLALRVRALPGWAVPALGGALFCILTVLWLTSALWFFTNVRFP